MGNLILYIYLFVCLFIFLTNFSLYFVTFYDFRLSVNGFAKDAEKFQVDLMADSEESRRLQTQIKKWDRKKKKMITINNVSLYLISNLPLIVMTI